MTHFNERAQYCRERKKHGSKAKNVVFGLLVILLGIVLIYRNMGLLDPEMHKIIFSWQMLLICIGFINLFGRPGAVFGLILMSVGTFFLLPRFFILPVNFTDTFWPLLIVIGGILIIFASLRKFRKIGHFQQSVTDDVLDDVMIFSGSERIVTTENFKGGKTVNIFGGSTYNLTHSKLSPGIHRIEVVCVFGGTKIIVPQDWNIKVEVASILGGFEDKRKLSGQPISTESTLIIKGVAVFGGGEISSL